MPDTAMSSGRVAAPVGAGICAGICAGAVVDESLWTGVMSICTGMLLSATETPRDRKL